MSQTASVLLQAVNIEMNWATDEQHYVKSWFKLWKLKKVRSHHIALVICTVYRWCLPIRHVFQPLYLHSESFDTSVLKSFVHAIISSCNRYRKIRLVDSMHVAMAVLNLCESRDRRHVHPNGHHHDCPISVPTVLPLLTGRLCPLHFGPV
jgi:hypothetical protein